MKIETKFNKGDIVRLKNRKVYYRVNVIDITVFSDTTEIKYWIGKCQGDLNFPVDEKELVKCESL